MPSDNQADNTTKVVLIVAGAVVGVILVLALACGGVTYFFFKAAEKTVGKMGEEMEKMREGMEALSAADMFLADLSSNQVDRAYGNTTRNYQARRKPEDLRAYVDQHPLLNKNANGRQPMMPLPAVVNDRVTLRIMLDGNPATVVTLDMVKEDGRWKVDEVVAP